MVVASHLRWSRKGGGAERMPSMIEADTALGPDHVPVLHVHVDGGPHAPAPQTDAGANPVEGTAHRVLDHLL
eukprot:10313929-Lingulodinium_polyedra.AAC.1